MENSKDHKISAVLCQDASISAPNKLFPTVPRDYAHKRHQHHDRVRAVLKSGQNPALPRLTPYKCRAADGLPLPSHQVGSIRLFGWPLGGELA
ncbi:hypothetical protein D910_07563 [Dendroctonus ponderosae]|uniref:Uncharacterized protein n=1 Tax=Dendroctonus ponderosae TaxID=77166 RepID=U4U8F9_DENPD|nr:hypothetical protein D910_07563 [Dendroctonus ponderosae]